MSSLPRKTFDTTPDQTRVDGIMLPGEPNSDKGKRKVVTAAEQSTQSLARPAPVWRRGDPAGVEYDMINTTAKTERDLRQRALDEAKDLFRANGSAAIPSVVVRAKDITKSIDDRRLDRLTLLELERLDRAQTKQHTSHAPGMWTPPVFSLAGIAALFGATRGSDYNQGRSSVALIDRRYAKAEVLSVIWQAPASGTK